MSSRPVPIVSNAWRRFPTVDVAPLALWMDACSASPAFTPPLGTDWCREAVAARAVGGRPVLCALRYRIDVVNWASRTDPLPSFWKPEWTVTAPNDAWWASAAQQLALRGGDWHRTDTVGKQWFRDLANRTWFHDRTLPVSYYDHFGVLCDVRNEEYQNFALSRIVEALAAARADAVALSIKSADQGRRWQGDPPRFLNWVPYTPQEWAEAWSRFVWKLHDARVRVITIEQHPAEHDWAWADEASRALLVGEFQEA